MQKISFNRGQVIFKSGDEAEGLYIVANGNVGLYFPGNDTANKPNITLDKTDIFGEMGVIDDQLRMATARAHTDVELIHVSRRDFDLKLDQTDVIVRGVMAVLSDRLRQLQQTKNKS